MKVLITGGCGFLGQMIAKAILARGELRGPDGNVAEVDSIQLFDQLAPVTPFDWADSRVTTAAGDISDKDTVAALVDRDDISVFHLASVVSAGGEKDFDLAMRVNLQGGLNILEAARAREGTPRLVFSSSLAVFGGPDLAKEVDDMTRHTPETTYGMTKAFGELCSDTILVCTSHAWFFAGHPDPEGVKLRLIRESLVPMLLRALAASETCHRAPSCSGLSR